MRLLEAESFLRMPVRKLSLGQRMRCDLIAAFLHRPRIVFLDEPTIGLDVVAKDAVRKFLLEVNRTLGTTILLTTHDLADIERLCPRVMVIDRGRLVLDGPIERLRARAVAAKTFRVTFREPVDPAALADGVPAAAVAWRFTGEREAEGILPRDRGDPAEVVRDLVNRLPVADLHVSDPSVEEIVRALYRGEGGA